MESRTPSDPSSILYYRTNERNGASSYKKCHEINTVCYKIFVALFAYWHLLYSHIRSDNVTTNRARLLHVWLGQSKINPTPRQLVTNLHSISCRSCVFIFNIHLQILLENKREEELKKLAFERFHRHDKVFTLFIAEIKPLHRCHISQIPSEDQTNSLWKVQSIWVWRGIPVPFSVMNPEPLLSPQCW